MFQNDSRLSIVQSIPALEALEAEWNRLADAMALPLLRHEWFLACAQTFYPEQDLRILVLTDGPRVRGIAPLVQVHRNSVQRIELIGAAHLHEPADLLFESPQALRELLAGIASLKKRTHLHRVADDGRLNRALASKPRWLSIRRPAAESIFLPISGTWESYHQSLGSRRRQDLRRAHRRTGAQSLRVDTYCPSVEEVDTAFDLACRIEASSWKGRRGSALLHRPSAKSFFQAYVRRCAVLGTLRMSFLWLDDHPCAMQIAVQAYRRLWVLKIGYDESRAACSPGVLLTEGVIRYAFEQGLEGYEFLGSPAPWLRLWTREAHPRTSFVIYPASLGGAAALAGDAFSFLARRLASQRTETVASPAR